MDLAGLPCIAQSDDELSELSCVAGFDDDVCIAGRESSDIDCCFAASARRPSQQRLASSASRVFAFSCLTFVVKDRRTRRERKLLDDVGARCDRATTTAVMGPSGSGKTTLISLLTLRAPRGRATGRVTLGGLALTQRRFRRLCFVVNQDDELWPTLTPREQLRHATQLFAAAGADIEPGRAEEIIDRLGLASCADTFVGHALVPGGLSGGQKRRLSIGVALVKQPVAAFLDEPTSGLDAAASLHTMAFVRSLAKDEHLIVVATIHQPSTKVFLDFDNLLLLSEGRVAYSGAAVSAAAAFEGLGHVLPPLTNPADFLLDVVNSDFSDAGVVREILDAYAAARERRREKVDDDAHFHGGGVDAGLEAAVVVEPTTGNQFLPLLRRHATLLARDLVLVGVRATCFFFGNLYFATVYVKSRERRQTQVANRVWLLIWMNAVPACLTLVIVVAINMETRMVKSGALVLGAVEREAALVAPHVVEGARDAVDGVGVRRVRDVVRVADAVREVADERVEAALPRHVLDVAVADVPLADGVGLVAQALHALGQHVVAQGHGEVRVGRDLADAALLVAEADLVGELARHERRPRRRAERLAVVARQLDAVAHELRHLRRFREVRRMPEVVHTDVVHEHQNDVGPAVVGEACHVRRRRAGLLVECLRRPAAGGEADGRDADEARRRDGREDHGPALSRRLPRRPLVVIGDLHEPLRLGHRRRPTAGRRGAGRLPRRDLIREGCLQIFKLR